MNRLKYMLGINVPRRIPSNVAIRTENQTEEACKKHTSEVQLRPLLKSTRLVAPRVRRINEIRSFHCAVLGRNETLHAPPRYRPKLDSISLKRTPLERTLPVECIQRRRNSTCQLRKSSSGKQRYVPLHAQKAIEIAKIPRSAKNHLKHEADSSGEKEPRTYAQLISHYSQSLHAETGILKEGLETVMINGIHRSPFSTASVASLKWRNKQRGAKIGGCAARSTPNACNQEAKFSNDTTSAPDYKCRKHDGMESSNLGPSSSSYATMIEKYSKSLDLDAAGYATSATNVVQKRSVSTKLNDFSMMLTDNRDKSMELVATEKDKGVVESLTDVTRKDGAVQNSFDWIAKVENVIKDLKRITARKVVAETTSTDKWTLLSVNKRADWLDRVVNAHKKSVSERKSQEKQLVPAEDTTSSTSLHSIMQSKHDAGENKSNTLAGYIKRGSVSSSSSSATPPSQTPPNITVGSSKEPQIELRMTPSQNESVVSINIDEVAGKSPGSSKREQLSVVISSKRSKTDNVVAHTPAVRTDFNSMQISISENTVPVKQLEFSINGKPVSELKSIIARANKLDVVTSMDKVEIRIPPSEKVATVSEQKSTAVTKTSESSSPPVLNLQIAAKFNEPRVQQPRDTGVKTSTTVPPSPVPSASTPPTIPTPVVPPPTRAPPHKPPRMQNVSPSKGTKGLDVLSVKEADSAVKVKQVEASSLPVARGSIAKKDTSVTPTSIVQSNLAVFQKSNSNVSTTNTSPRSTTTDNSPVRTSKEDRSPSNNIPWWSSEDAFKKIKKKGSLPIDASSPLNDETVDVSRKLPEIPTSEAVKSADVRKLESPSQVLRKCESAKICEPRKVDVSSKMVEPVKPADFRISETLAKKSESVKVTSLRKHDTPVKSTEPVKMLDFRSSETIVKNTETVKIGDFRTSETTAKKSDSIKIGDFRSNETTAKKSDSIKIGDFQKLDTPVKKTLVEDKTKKNEAPLSVPAIAKPILKENEEAAVDQANPANRMRKNPRWVPIKHNTSAHASKQKTPPKAGEGVLKKARYRVKRTGTPVSASSSTDKSFISIRSSKAIKYVPVNPQRLVVKDKLDKCPKFEAAKRDEEAKADANVACGAPHNTDPKTNVQHSNIIYKTTEDFEKSANKSADVSATSSARTEKENQPAKIEEGERNLPSRREPAEEKEDPRIKEILKSMKPIEKRKDGTLIDYGVTVPSRSPPPQSRQVTKTRSNSAADVAKGKDETSSQEKIVEPQMVSSTKKKTLTEPNITTREKIVEPEKIYSVKKPMESTSSETTDDKKPPIALDEQKSGHSAKTKTTPPQVPKLLGSKSVEPKKNPLLGIFPDKSKTSKTESTTSIDGPTSNQYSKFSSGVNDSKTPPGPLKPKNVFSESSVKVTKVIPSKIERSKSAAMQRDAEETSKDSQNTSDTNVIDFVPQRQSSYLGKLMQRSFEKRAAKESKKAETDAKANLDKPSSTTSVKSSDTNFSNQSKSSWLNLSSNVATPAESQSAKSTLKPRIEEKLPPRGSASAGHSKSSIKGSDTNVVIVMKSTPFTKIKGVAAKRERLRSAPKLISREKVPSADTLRPKSSNILQKVSDPSINFPKYSPRPFNDATFLGQSAEKLADKRSSTTTVKFPLMGNVVSSSARKPGVKALNSNSRSADELAVRSRKMAIGPKDPPLEGTINPPPSNDDTGEMTITDPSDRKTVAEIIEQRKAELAKRSKTMKSSSLSKVDGNTRPGGTTGGLPPGLTGLQSSRSFTVSQVCCSRTSVPFTNEQPKKIVPETIINPTLPPDKTPPSPAEQDPNQPLQLFSREMERPEKDMLYSCWLRRFRNKLDDDKLM